MARYEVPLTPEPQEFRLRLGAALYAAKLLWNPVAVAWVLDLATDAGQPVVSGIPLVTGADLLVPYKHLNFGGQLFATTDGDQDAPPTFTNLGSAGRVFFVTS